LTTGLFRPPTAPELLRESLEMPIKTQNLEIFPLKFQSDTLYQTIKGSVSQAVSDGWTTALTGSPVDGLVNSMEAGYAAMVQGDESLKAQIAPNIGSVAFIVFSNGWHEQGREGRSLAIYNACRKVVGDDVTSTDPDVLERYKLEDVHASPVTPAS